MFVSSETAGEVAVIDDSPHAQRRPAILGGFGLERERGETYSLFRREGRWMDTTNTTRAQLVYTLTLTIM